MRLLAFSILNQRSSCDLKHKYELITNNFVCFRHVQVNNDSAIEFYKKFGFEIVETKKQYYKRIEPSDAYVLQKTLIKKDQPLALTNGPAKS